MTGSLNIDPIFCLQELLNDPDGSEEKNRLGLALTCINNSDDLAYEYEDVPSPADERDDRACKTEQEQDETLVAVES